MDDLRTHKLIEYGKVVEKWRGGLISNDEMIVEFGTVAKKFNVLQGHFKEPIVQEDVLNDIASS